MKVGVALGTRIKGTLEGVGLGAGGQPTCLSPWSLQAATGLVAGLCVFPVALQVHKGISQCLLVVTGDLKNVCIPGGSHEKGRFVHMGEEWGSEPTQ